MGSINNLSSSYLQSILSTVFQSAGLTTSSAGNSLGIGTSSVASKTDSQQLSPLAQLMSTLQQLQQSDPAKYQQIAQQIATNLQTAAQTAQASGNSTEANQLTQLATDFTNAAKTGDLPSIQDLALAMGGHHHHHHSHSASADSDSSSGSTSSSSTTSQALSQLLTAFESNTTQNDSQNPMSIILNTLSNAGITSSSS